MRDTHALQELGLSKQEADIYLTLLRLGPSPASAIAKELTIKRTTVYAILNPMTARGLVQIYAKNNKRLFRAQKPQNVAALFEKKLEAFAELIPQLSKLQKAQQPVAGIRFIETKKELETFYTVTLKEYRNREYRVIGSTTAWENINPEFFQQMRAFRSKANIRTKLLLTSDSRSINPTDKKLLREFKYLPAKYAFKSTIDIFDDKILIIGPDQTGLAVVLEIPSMVDIFKSLFQIIWDTTPAK